MHDDPAATTPPRSPRPRVVALPKKRELHESHLTQLRASGLSDETIALAELYTEHNNRAIAELLARKYYPRMALSALVFPFYVPGADMPYGYRIRPTKPRVNKAGKPVKYDQADGTGTLVYYTPRARARGWYADTSATLYWSEGEKKALVFDQLGLACVGLTGVHMFADTSHRDDTGEWRFHPVIRDHVAIAGRRHVICFDADAVENDQVMHAAQRLCGVLLGAGAVSVKFVCPPTREQKGIDDYFAAFGEDVTRQLLAAAGEISPLDPKSPLQLAKKVRALADAPISDQLRLPPGYEVARDGTLWKVGDEKHGNTMIARSAMLPTRYLDDYYTHEARVEVTYDRNGSWATLCAARRALIDSRTMVAECGPYGAPVTSTTASKMVDWFAEVERVNVGRIDRVACVSRAGWHTIESERVFVLDKPLFVDDTHARPLALDTRGDRKKMFGALEPRGSIAAHTEALRRAFNVDPVCAALICGSLAATLLEPLGAQNFALHTPGDSSRGKTSMLKIAGSVFGDPHNEAWVASWNTTVVGAEMRAATLTDLPQCYDEVGSGDAQAIERLVYMLINGGGRSRAQKDLTMRETPSWRTVVLSTGERELADEGTATGAQIRVVQFPVSDFGKLGAREVDELREACAANAGCLGREWVESLLAIDDWAPIRETQRNAIALLRSRAADPLQGRVAAYFAVLMVAEGLLSQAFGIGDPNGGTMAKLFGDQARREQVQPLADRARDLVRDWVLAEPEAFPELVVNSEGNEDTPHKSIKVRHGFRRPGSLLLIPSALKSFVDGHRLSVREVVREWRRRGWLEHDHDHLTKLVRLGSSKSSRFYVLRDDDLATGYKTAESVTTGYGKSEIPE